MKMSFAIIIGGALFIFFAVVMAVVFIPGWIWNPPQTIAAHPYTAQELHGRQVYFSNGCDYCHTQAVRYYDVNFTGPISQGGNYVFDQPLTLGSERTGPDLSYIGRKRDLVWEIEHLKFPRKYSPMSIMPDWYFLPEQDLQDLAAYLHNLGDRTAAEWMIQPVVDYAQKPDTVSFGASTPDPNGNPQGWATWTASGLQAGKEIYIDRCQTCHGCAGNGLGTYAGTKIVTPANYKQEPFRSMQDDEWFWHVSEGIQGTVMPPWRESLSEEQRWNVIHYIQQEFANPVERDPDEGDPGGKYKGVENPLPKTVETEEHGKAVFIRECWVCHGDEGKGKGPYRDVLRPQPPDFSDKGHYGTMQNVLFTDADYYWRISEGLPWSAMPVWKVMLTDEDRWAVTYYLRVNFTQTAPRPQTDQAQQYPPIYLAQQAPVNLSPDDTQAGDNSQLIYKAPDAGLGKGVYASYCAHCHGMTGLGDGWDADYLDVKPANFHSADVRGLGEGDWFSRVSFGLQNSAMPMWNEWMPEQWRWNAIAYVQKTFMPMGAAGTGTTQPSVWQTNGGKVDNNFITLSQGDWTDEGNTIDTQTGQFLYTSYCSGCHGDKGAGIDPKSAPVGFAYPAPFPKDLPHSYVYQQIWQGVPNTPMFSFRSQLSPGDIWDIVVYLLGDQPGG
jgi:cbb3-type cytochrome oxidase cytochrome c subunit